MNEDVKRQHKKEKCANGHKHEKKSTLLRIKMQKPSEVAFLPIKLTKSFASNNDNHY